MRYSLVFLLFVVIAFQRSTAQIPTKCLEIENVLADACNNACPGAEEGTNEMFRFIVGPAPIPLNQLTAQWATPNGFLGWIQNGVTADLTAMLNGTITNCGWLIEPPGGIIPAGKRVLGITSTDICITGNSFALLADTLYVIYQVAGNTLGHFKNTSNIGALSSFPTSGSSYRTFVLSVPACSDRERWLKYSCLLAGCTVRELLQQRMSSPDHALRHGHYDTPDPSTLRGRFGIGCSNDRKFQHQLLEWWSRRIRSTEWYQHHLHNGTE